MKRTLIAGLILLSTTVAANAQTGTEQTAAPKVDYSQPARDINRREAREHLTGSTLIPLKILAVGTAAAVGVPIAVVRCESKRMRKYSDSVRDELNASDGSVPLVVASVPGQTLRAVGTVGEGLATGLFNATDGWDKPFSKASFSLKHVDLID